MLSLSQDLIKFSAVNALRLSLLYKLSYVSTLKHSPKIHLMILSLVLLKIKYSSSFKGISPS